MAELRNITIRSATPEIYTESGERNAYVDFLTEERPDLSSSTIRGLDKGMKAALQALGRDTINAAAVDIETFEARLALTNMTDIGLQPYEKRFIQRAVRAFYAYAQGYLGSDVRAVMVRKAPSTEEAREAGLTPFTAAEAADSGGSVSRPRTRRSETSPKRGRGAAQKRGCGQGRNSRKTPAHPELFTRAVERSVAEMRQVCTLDLGNLRALAYAHIELVPLSTKLDAVKELPEGSATAVTSADGPISMSTVINQVLVEHVVDRVTTAYPDMFPGNNA